ncbi:MAG: Flp pilus assembly complex ATPase component TadA [Pirellulales bacterium]|nr:Flp pilus assembly complex ATPase component TadA [Pirellulales bacterium]
MLRFSFIVTIMVLILTVGSGELLAQSGADWPSMELRSSWRGSGFYLGWIQILACWVVFAMWVHSADWASQDAQELKLNYVRWNPIICGPFFATFVLVWIIPYFWLAFPLLAIAYVAPFSTYVVQRNRRVTNDLRVFTPAHIRYWLAVRLAKVGVKIAAEAMDPHEKGPPVRVAGLGGADERENNARLLLARQTPGLLPARKILYDGLTMRASAIMLDYSQQAVGLRYLVDGVWLNQEPIERDAGDPALESLKVLCGMNSQDRQNRQSGRFSAEYSSVKYATTLTAQGTKSGERAVIQFEDKKIAFDDMGELGMREKIQEQIRELFYLEKGLLLFSAMPGGGLRSTADVVIRHTDRYTREFMAVEEVTNPYEKIENCPVRTYKAADGQTPVDVLPKVFREEPEVVVIRDLVDGETVDLVCDEIADEKRLIVSTIRAKDSAEALLRVLALGADRKKLAKAVSAVVSQRLVRKLCAECKEAYTPTPQVLQQLGIPEGRVKAFYRPPQEPEEVCEVCNGIGYLGRTAVFELLVVGDTVRHVLKADPKIELLRQAGRKDGMRSLQEEGILLVAKGVTSLPELMRVLKQ